MDGPIVECVPAEDVHCFVGMIAVGLTCECGAQVVDDRVLMDLFVDPGAWRVFARAGLPLMGPN